jgi:gas vesicle protein
MMRDKMEYFAIGALTGMLVGLLMGLLFAPASGAKTRRRLADEAFHAADLAREVAERAELAAEAISGRVDHYLGRDEELAWRKVKEIREGVQRYTRAQMSS